MPFAKQLDKIFQGKIWSFFGGIKSEELKTTSDSPIEDIGIPSLITLPLDRHLGEGGSLLVHVGDKVKAGQPLTIPGGKRNVPLHATTSGEITAINMQVLPHASGFLGRCIVIKTDGLDEKVPDEPMSDWQERTPQELLERIRSFGVEGLGGAQFQTAAKIGAALEEAKGDCNIFIVNGAECEPVATCDDRLMQEKAEEIAQGIEVVRRILKPKVIMVAIENNKPEAIAAMKAAVAEDVLIREIPTLYPSGAARNLIKICTGIEIPYNEHTSECGIVVDNVETVFAIKQAVIDGIPLIKRVITVDGQTLGKKGNAYVRLGTSVRYVLNAYKLNPERRQRIILGGPLMGFTLPTIDVPITKSATCIFAPSVKEVEVKPDAMNCIRCGRCARVCPSRLTPYQLYALSNAGQHKNTKKCGMMDCTECGCCAYVCPSRIPLTAQFRKEKAILRLLDDNQRRNQRAQERIAARNERLAKEEEQRKKRREAALARAAAQKGESINSAAPGAAPGSDDEIAAKRAAAVAAARERAAARRAAAAAAGNDNVGGASEHAQAAREEAIKAAAARRAAKLAESGQDNDKDETETSAAKAVHSGLKIKGIQGLADGNKHITILGAAAIAPDLDDLDNEIEEGEENLGRGRGGPGRGKERARRMMEQSKEGMLYAAMAAQGETPADDANASDNDKAADEAEAKAKEEEEKKDQLPVFLRMSAGHKKAPIIMKWPELVEHEQDLSIVDNPPAEGVIIPESKPRAKTYLRAPEEVKFDAMKLPKSLINPNYVPPKVEDEEENKEGEDSTKSESSDK